MERTSVDAVPVFWQQGPEPLSAGLVFEVGRRDEGFAEGGLTHLVEHLVMASLPRSHVDRNASVGAGTTEFTVTGRPEQGATGLGLLGMVEPALATLSAVVHGWSSAPTA